MAYHSSSVASVAFTVSIAFAFTNVNAGCSSSSSSSSADGSTAGIGGTGGQHDAASPDSGSAGSGGSAGGAQLIDCPGGDVVLDSDASVAALGSANCERVVGDLRLFSQNGLTTLAPLSKIRVVTGDLVIGQICNAPLYSHALVTLGGLENLTEVGKNLRIVSNAALVSIGGLKNLKTIGGHLEIGRFYHDNSALTSLAGLEALRSVHGDVCIAYCHELANVASLSGLESFDGKLYIRADSVKLSEDAVASLGATLEAKLSRDVLAPYEEGACDAVQECE